MAEQARAPGSQVVVNPPVAAPVAAPHPVDAPPAAAAHRTPQGTLTRAGMEHVIKSGGSVLHNGTIISNLAALPSEAQLASGDTVAEEAALANINRQRAALDVQEAQLKASKPSPAKK